MASLKNNGTEIARLARTFRLERSGTELLETISFRSNGWILEKYSNSGWKRYGKMKYDASKIPAVVDRMMRDGWTCLNCIRAN